ncbi:MAG: thioredoxin family protein [Planctomycetaceae bacterium]|nr:thioredoxin family protein [Planctomycetaceae bacterium]
MNSSFQYDKILKIEKIGISNNVITFKKTTLYILGLLLALTAALLFLPMFASNNDDSLVSPTNNVPSQQQAVEVPCVTFHDDYKSARRIARETSKPLMLFFTTSDCVFSEKMVEGTFRDPDVVEISDRFTCVKIYAETNEDLCKEFRIKGYPTIQFMSPQGVLLKRLSGSQTAAQLTTQMTGAIQIVTKPTQVVLQ